MIAIINQNKLNKKGETLYHIKINHKFISKFYHKRSDGLYECLNKASIAVLTEHKELLTYIYDQTNAY